MQVNIKRAQWIKNIIYIQELLQNLSESQRLTIEKHEKLEKLERQAYSVRAGPPHLQVTLLIRFDTPDSVWNGLLKWPNKCHQPNKTLEFCGSNE